jgi:8-oxo-dGTP diphosphatase
MDNPESIAGLVFSPDRLSILLILRRDVPVWVLPGGGIDPGEAPEQAVLREILEETGLTVKIDRLVGRYYPINRLAKRTLLYECSILQGQIQATEETRASKFFPLTSLPPQPPPYPEWIEEGRVFNPPVTRDLLSVNYATGLKYALTHPLLLLRFLLARMGWPVNTKD